MQKINLELLFSEFFSTNHIWCNPHMCRKSILQNAEAKKLQPINFCSKEDKDIVFCSKDECGSYEDNWPAHTTKDGCHMAPDNNDSDYENRSAKSCGCKVRPGDYPLAASQNANKYSCKGPISPKKARQKTGQRRKVSNRLVAPTITSLAKSGGLEKDKPKSCGARPVSERAVNSITLSQSALSYPLHPFDFSFLHL